jgi:putative flippase GtrA
MSQPHSVLARAKRQGQQLRECDQSSGVQAQHLQACQKSYSPTGRAYVDTVLELIDRLTRGHADWFQRAFSYLIFGGFSALVNLAVFSLVYYWLPWPVERLWQYAVAVAVASEVSILVNFFPNDAITFRRLPGHRRPLLVRCIRFHGTYLLGTLLQLFLSFSLHLLGSPAVFAQALAIALVTAFNFAFHHIFTYGRITHPGERGTTSDPSPTRTTRSNLADEVAQDAPAKIVTTS